MATTNWAEAFQPLIKKYKGRKHPLDYKNLYQLVVMVILSAQDSDRHINQLASDLFKAFPDMKALATANEATLLPFIGKVRNSRNKISWLLKLAQAIKTNDNIPLTLEGLTQYAGIGRKSANVILREAGKKAEGIIVDLHVVRVAPRIGVASGTDPKKIEQQLMDALPQKDWGEAGMAISFLGREVCRPSHPEHHECVMSPYCEFFKEQHGSQKSVPKKVAKAPVGKLSSATKSSTSKTAAKVAVTKKASGSASKKAAKKVAVKAPAKKASARPTARKTKKK